MSGEPREEEENAAELKIGEEFLKAKCLMNCEVAIILEHKYEQLQHMSSDGGADQVSQVFEKSQGYVKRFSRYKNPDAVRQVRETLSRYSLHEFELCTLGNLCPDTADEARALVPSLVPGGRFQGDDRIDKMLNDLSLIKKFE
ncbi:DNA-directed RNA polymerase II subunit 4-like [Lolium rigidum]|uniref:DNA-directed RNA polymerase II subunit 4-like n=1 Tax=Lolium rigidum TaxID=89674 RepID=UPI001F5CBE40|nr:DNA-directed RNA polymerase II subunit 4-like [Lolium rigidum]